MARRALYDGDVGLLRSDALAVASELGRVQRIITRAAQGRTVGETAKLLQVVSDAAQELLVKAKRLAAHAYTVSSPTRSLPPAGKRRHGLSQLAADVNRLVK